MKKTAIAKKPSTAVSASTKQRGSSVVQQRRHAGIVPYLKKELAEWIAALGDRGPVRRAVVQCPICGRASDRLRNMKRHALTHTSGKLASMIGGLETGTRAPHPVYTEVVRALYDYELMVDNKPMCNNTCALQNVPVGFH